MAVNKVDINGATVLDLTGDSVTPETLLQGATAHDASGAAITGTMVRGTELKIIVSVASGATVTATKGSKVVSGTAINGTCTLTVPEEGEWTVSATLGGATSESNIVKVASSYDTTLLFVSTTLNDNSWETIRDISDAGIGANYWSVGDRKAVTLNGTVGALTLSNFTTYAFIIGFNHNSSLEGVNRIHFQLAKTALSGGTDVAFCDKYYINTVGPAGGFCMNFNNTNTGGWKDSVMRKIICGAEQGGTTVSILNVISDGLKSALKSVTKYTDNVGNTNTSSNSITATTDYFFILSEFEVFGDIRYANSNEKNKQAQYAYYSAGNSKIKYKHDGTSTAAAWWVRSPIAINSSGFVGVYDDGTVGAFEANYSIGFAPGFCV